MFRILSLLIGYFLGGFLTARVVTRLRTGKDISALGSGNPGTANVAAQLGPGWGALVLLGDVAKTAVACFSCGYLLFPETGRLAVLYAGLGAALGHDFPFWGIFCRGGRIRGGKGVAVTVAAAVFASPLSGILSGLAGGLACILWKNLKAGIAVIGVGFPVAMLLVTREWEPLAAAAALGLLLLWRGLRKRKKED